MLESANRGDAICCKPDDAAGGHCQHKNLICSMPAMVTGEEDKYFPVASPDMNNYQMMAFCPHIDQEKCGISSDTDN